MKIKDIQTKIVNAEMRNWVFVKVITDKDFMDGEKQLLNGKLEQLQVQLKT